MSIQVIGLIGFAILILSYGVYRRYARQQKRRHDIIRHIEHIRQHQVLIKPEKIPNTFSGKFAGQRLRFSFREHIEIQAEIQANLDSDSVWIYSVKHPFKDDKLTAMLEKNRAWTGDAEFDRHYILAGRPRHLANAIMQPAKRLRSQLLKYPESVVLIDDKAVILLPNPKQPSDVTSEDWREWMGMISDIAEYTEAQYEAPMFSGIAVDESAYPKHDSGHVD